MGLIKTAIMSGAAMYGVHELSKGIQNHQSNQHQQQYQHQQRYTSNQDTSNRENQQPRSQPYYQQDPPARDCDYIDMPYTDNYGYTNTYDQRNLQRDMADYDRGIEFGNEQRRAASTGPALTRKGSSGDYYHDAPPRYDDRDSVRTRPGGGFVEGEVYDEGYRVQTTGERGGVRGGRGSELLEMLGSQLGSKGERSGDKKGKSGAEKAARAAGMLAAVPGFGRK